MAKSAGGKRINLQLDPRVAFEALILNRMDRIPEGRRQEWLRGLLVQGFRQECQSLRVVQDEIDPQPIKTPQGQGVSARQPRTAFAAWLAQPVASPDTATKTPPVAVEANTAAQGKPFAGLRKVIG
ncbi:MAG: hypothetical protein GC149_18835 [Gammaproteobacteria bacterium]|nr:hypothetical protein [Gammaproteobacteria bacterium]